MIPSVNELRLIEQNHRLRIRIEELERKNIRYTPEALPEEMPTHATYELPAYIRVSGTTRWLDTGFEFLVVWEVVGQPGFNQMVYKADFAALTPQAQERIIENMLGACIRKLVSETIPE